MFLIIALCGAVLGMASVIALLVVTIAMKSEDRTRTSVHHAPRGLPGAFARRTLGLHVIDPPGRCERTLAGSRW
ncbi:hypothetical protein J5X84_40390 [Streptosporangiaceae bacterium NEAU-GS5]|nr:hypothetical protein [Streptosporangiaceae bacterium NEAU-GS5]